MGRTSFNTPETSPLSLYTRLFGEGFQDPNNPNDPGLRQPPLPGEPMGLYQVPVAVDTTGRRSGATARILDMPRSNLYKKIEKYDLIREE